MANSERVDVSVFLDSQPIGIRQWIVFALCLVVLGMLRSTCRAAVARRNLPGTQRYFLKTV